MSVPAPYDSSTIFLTVDQFLVVAGLP